METGVNSFSRFKEAFRLKEADASQYSPLVLAYIGDAVYEIMIRTKVVNDGNVQVNKLHKHTAGLVKASAQMELLLACGRAIRRGKTVCRRGRNAKSGSMAKNATMKEYRMATGFEALVGYLYLAERFDRLTEVVSLGLEKIGELKEEDGR